MLEPRYRLQTGADFLWKSVEDGALCYELESGQTRLISPLAHFILNRLSFDAGATCSSSEISRWVQEEEPDFSFAECQEHVAATLQSLRSGGFVVEDACEGQ